MPSPSLLQRLKERKLVGWEVEYSDLATAIDRVHFLIEVYGASMRRGGVSHGLEETVGDTRRNARELDEALEELLKQSLREAMDSLAEPQHRDQKSLAS